jgi:hypothetical protein
MGQGIDHGDVEGVKRVELMGEPDPMGLKAEEHGLRISPEAWSRRRQHLNASLVLGAKPPLAVEVP